MSKKQTRRKNAETGEGISSPKDSTSKKVTARLRLPDGSTHRVEFDRGMTVENFVRVCAQHFSLNPFGWDLVVKADGRVVDIPKQGALDTALSRLQNAELLLYPRIAAG